MKLRPVTQIGTQFVATFKLQDGTLQKTVLTQAQYKALNQKGMPILPASGATWLSANDEPVYDVTDGMRQVGDIMRVSGGYYVILADYGEFIDDKSTTGIFPNITTKDILSDGSTITKGDLTLP